MGVFNHAKQNAKKLVKLGSPTLISIPLPLHVPYIAQTNITWNRYTYWGGF